MGFPLIFAIGAAAVGAAALYKAVKDDDDDYSSGGWSDSSADQRRAEEEARREREERERQNRVAQLEEKINQDLNTAHQQLVTACRTLESSELFSVDYNGYMDEDEMRELLSDEAEASNKFDAKNKLLNTKTNKNLAILDTCSSDIYIELSEDGEKICKAYNKCKQSELELKKRNEQLTNALKQLKQNHEAMRNAKAS